jgi:hypothetical protein
LEKPSDYPTLELLIAARINVELIRAHWPEIRKRRGAPTLLPRQGV